MTRWMILQRDYGQLGNRLHTHANALAWCIENNVNLLNLSFQYFAINFGQNRNQNAEIFTVKRNSQLTVCQFIISKHTHQDLHE